jgi:hypothetical protein
MKLCVVLSLLCFCTFLKAQANPCGYPSGNACPSNCGNVQGNFKGFQFDQGGPNYGVNATINCGTCSYIQVNADLSPTCFPPDYSLNRQAIKNLLASANGRQILIPSCGGGFKQFVETPMAVAEEHWEFPKVHRILVP